MSTYSEIDQAKPPSFSQGGFGKHTFLTTPAEGREGGELQKKTAIISNVISVPPNPLIVLYFWSLKIHLFSFVWKTSSPNLGIRQPVLLIW